MLHAKEWSGKLEKDILLARDTLVVAFVAQGYNVVVDDTNLDPKHESRIRELVKDKATVQVRFFDVPVETCVSRDLQRNNGKVGRRVIEDMFRRFIYNPSNTPKVVHNPSLPYAIICDVDGTLAHMSGRGPYDSSKYDTDVVDQAVKSIVNSYYRDSSYEVLITSGREEKYQQVTSEWLVRNGVSFSRLIMRPTGDNRQDAIVKKELYEKHIKDKYNILFVLDDRNRVVDMWREQGLKCLQVARGDF
jgi:hypothetical protein